MARRCSFRQPRWWRSGLAGPASRGGAPALLTVATLRHLRPCSPWRCSFRPRTARSADYTATRATSSRRWSWTATPTPASSPRTSTSSIDSASRPSSSPPTPSARSASSTSSSPSSSHRQPRRGRRTRTSPFVTVITAASRGRCLWRRGPHIRKGYTVQW
jgi:hypothetical protein